MALKTVATQTRHQPHIHSFVVRINSEHPCENERRFFQEDEMIVDVTCDINILVNEVMIEGLIAASICTINISPGRNVAILQKASQSSTNLEQEHLNYPHHAVDGNVDRDYNKGSCTLTDAEVSAYWRLDFNRPQVLLRINVINRNIYTSRLNGFTLVTFSETGNETNRFQEESGFLHAIFKIDLHSKIPTSSILITHNEHLPLADRYLTLCEVEAIGETVCPKGSYGLWCHQNCRCKKEELCNMVTGACAPGCEIGFYGNNCSSLCSDHCNGHSCMDSGECVQCSPGYTGVRCATVCEPGNFGLECMYTCSEHCANVCHHITGKCACIGKYMGTQCTECPHGKYGAGCSLSCPKLCYGDVCNMETGACMSCLGRRVGPYCEDCEERYYGPLCYTECSAHCFNKTCDKVNGNCAVCTDGYTGEKCDEDPAMQLLWLILICPLLVLLISIIALFCTQRRPYPPGMGVHEAELEYI